MGSDMRIKCLGVIALGLLTAACGTNQEQRTATGGLLGVGIGALAGGPVGAAIGLGAGVAGGALMPEDATSIANNLLGREHRAARAVLNEPRSAGMAAPEASGSSEAPIGLIKQAQTQLKDQGFYKGRVDGIVGPLTHNAVRAYQKREGLRQTAQLDRQTMQRMNLAATLPAQPDVGSGSSAPRSSAPQGNLIPDNRSPQNYDLAAPQTGATPPIPQSNDQPTGTSRQNP
jgi:peptidoglycan hydrolase-like protein with peptidoglycan-binding domain